MKKTGLPAIILLSAAAVLFTLYPSETSFAATTINKVNLSIDTDDIYPGSEEKYIGVTSDSDEYYVSNEQGSASNMSGGKWKSSSTPRFTVTIKNESGYKFNTAKLDERSYYSFSGDTVSFVKAKGSSTSITLTVKMPKLNSDGSSYDLEVTDLDFDEENARASWAEASSAERYYIRLYRNSNLVDSVSTADTEYDFSNIIKKTGDYSFKVRAYDGSSYGEWASSDSYHISSSELDGFKSSSSNTSGSGSGPGVSGSSSGPSVNPSQGAWLKDSVGWWYCNADRSYTASNWQYIDNKWYYFNASGYMVTGWIQWKNKWYYCGSDGAMYANTTTPDGYRVDSNGAWIQ